MNTDLTAAALAAAERGWHIFPVMPGGKTPAVKRWEQRATTNPDRIRRCWAAGGFNIGIACGPSGLVVVDLDKPKPGQQPPTEWQQPGIGDGADLLAALAEQAGEEFPVCTYAVSTASGGLHLYYQHPQTSPQLRNTAGQLGWLIDTRAAGGYVIAAGSHNGQAAYTIAWGEELTPAALPEWLAERLQPQPRPPAAPVTVHLGIDRRSRYLHTAISRQIEHVQHAEEGTRNHALYTSAVALGQLAAGGALGEQEIEGLLTQAALTAGLRPAETRRTICSGLKAGARRPRTVTS